MSINKDAKPMYRQLLSDAWKLTITHKHLWVFGFFATFVGFGGVSEVLFGVFDRVNKALPSVVGTQETPLLLLPGFATLRALVDLSPYPVVSVTIFSLAVLAIFAVFAWIVSTAIGSLVWSIRDIEQGGSPTFSEGLKSGNTTFKKVFAIMLSSKIFVGILFLLAGVNLLHLMSDRTLVSAFFFLSSYILFTAIAVVVSIASIFAVNHTVIEKLPVLPSFVAAFKTIKKNWLISIEMTIILLMINIFFAIIAMLIAMVLSAPIVFLFLFAALIKSGPLLTIMMALTVIVLIAVIVLIGSFMTTFQSTVWTLLWGKINQRGGTHHPKIHRLVEWLKRKLHG